MPDKEKMRQALQRPIRLTANRVYRFYRGGYLIDKFRGAPDPQDTQFPEDWIGSVTRARNTGRERIGDEGLSYVQLPGGESVPLTALVEEFPDALLGPNHVAKYGDSTGLLVKLLDTGMRLPIHCHPTRDFARRHLQSIFGKAEAWIILQTRSINGQEPYIMLGFKEGITPAVFRRQVAQQDVTGLKAALHRIPVKPGNVFFVKPGLPHAIGPGCFLIEPQEPTDYSVIAEYKGFPISESSAHMGWGWDRALECYDFTTYTPEGILNDYLLKPQPLRSQGRNEEWLILGGKTEEFFSARRLCVADEFANGIAGVFHINIVTAGRGAALGGFGTFPVAEGDTFLVPASLAPYAFRSEGKDRLEIIQCLPPA